MGGIVKITESEYFTLYKNKHRLVYRGASITVRHHRLKPLGDILQDRIAGVANTVPFLEQHLREIGCPNLGAAIVLTYLAIKNSDKSIDFYNIEDHDPAWLYTYSFFGICADDKLKPPIPMSLLPSMGAIAGAHGTVAVGLAASAAALPTTLIYGLAAAPLGGYMAFKWKHIKEIAQECRLRFEDEFV